MTKRMIDTLFPEEKEKEGEKETETERENKNNRQTLSTIEIRLI